VVWGDRIVWGDGAYESLVWNNTLVWGDHIVWGDCALQYLQDNGLLACANTLVWGDRVVWGDRLVWGDLFSLFTGLNAEFAYAQMTPDSPYTSADPY
jgi:hypothetical protein